MKYIRKPWARILISLLLGGFFSELMVLKTGHEDQPTLIYAALAFLFLQGIVFYDTYKYYFFGNKNHSENRTDILDD